MYRTRDFRRKMRSKFIVKRKRLAATQPGLKFKEYDNLGSYSKNKIHFNDRTFSKKTEKGRHIITPQENFKEQDLKEFLAQEA